MRRILWGIAKQMLTVDELTPNDGETYYDVAERVIKYAKDDGAVLVSEVTGLELRNPALLANYIEVDL